MNIPQGHQYYVKGENGAIEYQHYYHTNEHDEVGEVPLSKTEPLVDSYNNVNFGQKPQPLTDYDGRK